MSNETEKPKFKKFLSKFTINLISCKFVFATKFNEKSNMGHRIKIKQHYSAPHEANKNLITILKALKNRAPVYLNGP